MAPVDSKPVGLSTRMKMRHAFDQLQGFRERDTLKDAEPFTRMPVVGQVETVPADVFEAREGRLEFRLARTGVVGPEAGDEAVLVAVPFPVNGDRIIELRGADRGQKARLEHVSDELLAGRRDGRFLACRRLVPGTPPNVDPTAPGHGRSTGKTPPASIPPPRATAIPSEPAQDCQWSPSQACVLSELNNGQMIANSESLY
jgi:hypothetical protein